MKTQMAEQRPAGSEIDRFILQAIDSDLRAPFALPRKNRNMAAAVYLLGILVTLACALLLLRGYVRGKKRLLVWRGLCFTGLTITNALVGSCYTD